VTNDNQKYLQLLQQGLRQMDIDLPLDRQLKLIEFVNLLVKWSKVYNLTTVRDAEGIIKIHILDSLTVLPFIADSKNVLDVGTGAGLPGIPLAIACPGIQFSLVDSQQKKINFVQHVITSLALTNVTAVWQRIETLQANSPSGDGVDTIVSRAFASLSEFVNLIVNICDSKTKIVAMKGRYEIVQQEQQQLPATFELGNIERVSVPGIDAERCLVFLRRK
jgi:16S rRNA (guanine527-N7)-methyltransferase